MPKRRNHFGPLPEEYDFHLGNQINIEWTGDWTGHLMNRMQWTGLKDSKSRWRISSSAHPRDLDIDGRSPWPPMSSETSFLLHVDPVTKLWTLASSSELWALSGEVCWLFAPKAALSGLTWEVFLCILPDIFSHRSCKVFFHCWMGQVQTFLTEALQKDPQNLRATAALAPMMMSNNRVSRVNCGWNPSSPKPSRQAAFPRSPTSWLSWLVWESTESEMLKKLRPPLVHETFYLCWTVYHIPGIFLMDSYTNDTEIHRPKSHWFTTYASDQKSWGSLEILGILGIACGTGAAIRPYRYGCAAPAAPLPSHPSPSPRIELLDAGIQQMAGLSSLNFLMWPMTPMTKSTDQQADGWQLCWCWWCL